jgi:lipopolysaccharide export system ATP-binding protein
MIRSVQQTGDLVAETVFKRFGAHEILKGVFFRAHPGEITALLGVNGCGKSTLLRLIAGVLRADSGRFVHGDCISDRPSLASLARRGLAYLPQDPMLLADVPVKAQLHSFNPDKGRTEAVVKTLDIETVLDRRPQTLSGGERRRCDLAAVLVRSPRIMLVDEPFTGIAPIDVPYITNALRQSAASGAVVVITDHAVEFTLAAAQAVWFLDGGTCRYVGDANDAVVDAELRRDYLGRRAAVRGNHTAA